MSLIVSRDFARNAYLAKHPRLWNGLIGAWCPSVGLRGMPNVSDFSLFRRSATANGTMTNTDYVPGHRYLSLDFDGTDDFLEIADRDDLSPNVSYTVATLIRFNSIVSGTTQMLVTKDNNAGAGTREYQLSYNSSFTAFTFTLFVAGSTSSTSVSLTALGVPVAGTWYLVVGRKDASAGTISIWVNGQKNSTANTNIPTGASTVRIGRLGGASPFYFNGRMQDTFIWRRHLSDTELSSIYGGDHPLERKPQPRSFRVPGGAITLTASPAISTWTVNNGSISLGATIVLTASPAISTWTVNNGAISLGSDVVIAASPAIAIWTVNSGTMDVAGSVTLTASPAISTWFALDGAISIPAGPITLTASPAIFTWTALDGTIPGGPITLTLSPAISTWVAVDVTLVSEACYVLQSCPLSSTRFTLTNAPPK